MDTTYVLELTAADGAGAPIPGVELSVVNNRTGAISARYTDGAGYTNHGMLGHAGDLCTVQSNGYRIAGAAPAAPPEGPQYVYLPTEAAVALSFTLDAYARPTGRELTANLVTDGWRFRLDDGRRFTAIEASDFNVLNRWQHGEDIRPLLQQRGADCGYNMLRVWTAYDIPGIGTFLDIDYAQVPAFVALCARYGLYVEFTAYTGINDPQHWPQLIAAALACPIRPLLELVNELDQNTNEPDPSGRVFILEDYAQAPAPLLSAHGSNGSQALPVRPWWSYETIHFNDASEWQRKVGHNAMEATDGTVEWPASHVPILSNENTRYMDKAQNIDIAHDAAAGAALLCAGSCFHSQRGKTSERWDGDELLAAQAWARGAASVDLDCQQGPYYRHDPGVYLRVYERPTAGEFCIVEISKEEGPA